MGHLRHPKGAGTVEIVGEQSTVNTWTFNSGTVKCEEATAIGGPTGATTEPTAGVQTHPELTVHTTYNRCKAFGLAATVGTTGCNTIYATATTTTGEQDAHAAVTLECEGGNKVVVNAGAGGCIVEIGAQIPGGVVDIKNEQPVGGKKRHRDLQQRDRGGPHNSPCVPRWRPDRSLGHIAGQLRQAESGGEGQKPALAAISSRLSCLDPASVTEVGVFGGRVAEATTASGECASRARILEST